LPAHYIDHYNLNPLHETDGEYAVFTVTAIRFLENRPIEDHPRILEIDEMLCEVRLPLALIPLEKHP